MASCTDRNHLWDGRMWISRGAVILGWVTVLCSLPMDFCTNFGGGQYSTLQFVIFALGILVPISWPVFLAVIFFMLGSIGAAIWGGRRIIWAIRIVSVPISILVIWFSSTFTPASSGSEMLVAGLLISAAATWLLPVRRRKSSPPGGNPQPACGGVST